MFGAYALNYCMSGLLEISCLLSCKSLLLMNTWRTLWLKCWAMEPACNLHCMPLEGQHFFGVALNTFIKDIRGGGICVCVSKRLNFPQRQEDSFSLLLASTSKTQVKPGSLPGEKTLDYPVPHIFR